MQSYGSCGGGRHGMVVAVMGAAEAGMHFHPCPVPGLCFQPWASPAIKKRMHRVDSMHVYMRHAMHHDAM